MSESILQKAEELINGDRSASYGSPLEQYTHLAALFNAYLGIDTITWQDAINMMLLIKVNRVRPGKPFHRDSYTDTAGYAGCAEKAFNESQVDEFDYDAIDEHIAEHQGPITRQWEFLNAMIPDDVVAVIDADDDLWVRPEGPKSRWYCKDTSKSLGSTWSGPFTEVLDG